MTYAKETSVSVERSRAEIETVLRRYGASQFGYMTGADRAQIAFECRGKLIRFSLPMPDPNDERFTLTDHKPAYNRKRLSPEAAQAKWEQACRSRWRALLLAIKAKLEATEVGISTFEHEFMAHIVLPNGRTFGDEYIPQIEGCVREKRMPTMLLGPATEA